MWLRAKESYLMAQEQRGTVRGWLAGAIVGGVLLSLAGGPRVRAEQLMPLMPLMPLRAAAAVIDVTPDLPVSINGGMSDRVADAVADRLHARALVLDDGRLRIAIVECDFCMIPDAVGVEAAARIQRATGIPPEALIVGATHTHSAPTAGPCFQSVPSPGVVGRLVDGIVQAVTVAVGRLEPARVGTAVEIEPNQVFNRRWFMRPGVVHTDPFGRTSDRVRMNPPPGSPDLLAPAGPVDPDVTVLSVTAADGRPIALLANYALHYVGGVPGTTISADYFGRFASEITAQMGAEAVDPPFVPILTNGSSGDINNISFLHPHPAAAAYERIGVVAKAVAKAALEARGRIEYAADARLGLRHRVLRLGVRRPTAVEVARAQEILAAAQGRPLKGLEEVYANETVHMADMPAEVDVAVRAITIGGLGIAAIPCEVFVDIGLEIKRRSPFAPTFTLSLAGGYHGYLPTARHHALGGYETWRARSSYLEVGAAARIVDACAEMFDEIRQDMPSAAAGRHGVQPAAAAVRTVPAAAPPASETQGALRVVDPFVVELMACEPAVVDPVAITFDEQGRPYVVEYRDYPQGPPAGAQPLSRVVRLDDADGDGRYESSTVVADGLSFAQGVLAVPGGLLVTAAPDLLLLRDTDGDGRADQREIVATGFAVGNPQLRAACPQLGMENSIWITGGLSGGMVLKPGAAPESAVSINRRDVRIDLARGTIAAASGFGQFGNTFDDIGRRFTVSNRNPVMAVRLPAEALDRNTLVDLGGGYEDVAPSGADSRVFPTAQTRATAASHTGTHTSACGLSIFRGDLLGPQAVGDAFVCEPVSHLVTRRRLTPAGTSFTSARVEADGVEFLASRDVWFRPVFTATGPDGALWVIDMCRETIEHPAYMPPGLADTLDLRAGDTAGRVWRIRHRDLRPRPWKPPTSAAAAVNLLGDPNGWRRSTAQRLLSEGRFTGAANEVSKFLDASLAAHDAAVPSIHALWTLEALGRLSADHLRQAAAAPQPSVRETAARLVAEGIGLSIPETAAAAAVLRDRLAAAIGKQLSGDPDGHVRLAATLAVAGSQDPSAAETLAVIAARPDLDRWISRAVVSGAVLPGGSGRSAAILMRLADEPIADDAGLIPTAAGVHGLIAPRPPQVWQAPRREIVRLVEQLGATAAGTVSQRQASGVAADGIALMQLLANRARRERTSWFDVAILAGMSARLPLTTLSRTSEDRSAIDAVVAHAAGIATDTKQPTDIRCVSILLLGSAATGPGEAAGMAAAALTPLVGTHELEDVQREAVRALVRCGQPAAAVVQSLTGLEPTVRDAAVAALLDRTETIPLLLEAIEGGSVPASFVPLARRAALSRSAEQSVRERAGRIWHDQQAAGLSPDEIRSLLAAVRHGGDQERGRTVFSKQCAHCHRVAGAGNQVGPDLAEAGDRPVDRLVTDIIDPNHSIEARWESTIVITSDGEALEGLLDTSGLGSVVLCRPGGERRTVPRDQIETLRGTGMSLMPVGFGRQLSAPELADLIAFLRSGRPVPPTP